MFCCLLLLVYQTFIFSHFQPKLYQNLVNTSSNVVIIALKKYFNVCTQQEVTNNFIIEKPAVKKKERMTEEN